MSYTYSGNPASSPVDATHYYLGDTNSGDPIATDEECAFALCQNGHNPMLAAADLAETKALQFVWRPTMVKKGDRTTMYAAQVEGFRMLAASLRAKASLATTGLYAGGLDVSEHQSDAADLSLRQPFATKHLHETSPHHRAGVFDLSRED